MFQIRKSKERGYADRGWLKSYHTFSFSDYYDEKFMGFGPLRVINEDFIEGGQGFPTHGHQDMEIITYLMSGALAHKDSTGSEGIIYPYEVQKMTAGNGIRHSEFNYLKDKETHLLQIWIMPDKNGLTPSYEQKNFQDKINTGKDILLASLEGQEDSLKIHQDILIWAKKNKTNEKWQKELNPKRKYWLQVVKGELDLASTPLLAGDGLAIIEEEQLVLNSKDESEILFFDMK
ncbi:MAG: pirin family protein [Bdellovibrionota bacterium]